MSDGAAGVVIKLPANQPLPAPFLDTLLQGLRAGGPLRAVSLAELFAADPHGSVDAPEPGPTVVGAPLSSQDLTAYGNNLAATNEIVDGYSTFAGRVDPLTEDLRRRLLVSGLQRPDRERAQCLPPLGQPRHLGPDRSGPDHRRRDRHPHLP